jgi:hypothetical protein
MGTEVTTRPKPISAEGAGPASSFILGAIGFVPEPSPVDRSAIPQASLQIVIVQGPGGGSPPRIIGPEPMRQIDHEPAKAV